MYVWYVYDMCMVYLCMWCVCEVDVHVYVGCVYV